MLMNVSSPHQGRRLQSMKIWMTRHRVALAIIVGASIVAGSFIFALYSMQSNTQSRDTIGTYTPKPAEKVYSLLTGQQLADESMQTDEVTAVIIENSPDARPQSGLKKAGVVYEATAEGGITRFMALYQHDKPELIGPVRSLRIYYLDWAAPYQASIAHVGGSNNALEAVRSGYRDIDQYYNAGTYWRASDRYAPHNVYTSGTNINELNAAKGYTASSFKSFTREDGKAVDEPTATTISIDFSSAPYGTSYTYDKESNTYLRSLAGQPHQDREEGQLAPSVLIALRVGSQLRSGPDGYEDLVTSGSGQAYVFQNGAITEATWRKDGRDEPLQLINADGSTLPIGRGQTWIAAVTDRGSISWQ